MKIQFLFSAYQSNRTNILMKNSSSPVQTHRAAGIIQAAMVLLVLLGILGDAAVSRAASSPPDRMTYQGFLVDGNDDPLAPTVPVNYPVTFRIYDASDAGNLLWAEQQIVTVDKGSFSVVLGEGTDVAGEPRGLLSTVFLGATASERYISVTVTIGQNSLTLLPRLRLLPSPYAFLASQAVQLVNPSTGAPFLSLNAGEATLPGNARFESELFWGTGAKLSIEQGGSIELGNSLAGSAFPYVDFHYGRGANQDFNVRLINDGDGRLSLHGGRLSFGNALANTKISLWDNGGATYGLGIQSGQYRLHLDTSGARFSFLNAPAGTEVMTIQGNGNVGINSVFPSHKLEVYGGDNVASFGSAGGNAYLRVWDNTGFHNRVEFASRGNGRAAIWSGNDHFNVLQNGRVGIGTITPNAALEVRGWVNSNQAFTYYARGARNVVGFNGGFDVGIIGQAAGVVDYSIIAERRIGASEFNAFSDARIKDVLRVSDGQKDLDLIRQLQVKDYYFVDKVAEGGALKKGFIAQEVRALMPDAVTTSTRFIPDIYALPEAHEYDAASQRLTITLAKAHEIKEGDRIQVIADSGRLELTVGKVISPRKFTLEKCESKPSSLFVFGKQVSDFLVLNYDQIFSTGISAIQELSKIVESKDARIASLERELASLKKQVAANDNANARWEARFAELEKTVAAVTRPVVRKSELASNQTR